MVGQSPKAFPLPCSARTQKTMEGEFGADHCIVEVGVIKRFYLVICRFVAVPASLLYLTTSLFTFGGPESSLAGARLLSSSHLLRLNMSCTGKVSYKVLFYLYTQRRPEELRAFCPSTLRKFQHCKCAMVERMECHGCFFCLRN